MSNISLTPGQVGAMLRAANKRNLKAIKRGQKLTSARIVTFLKKMSPVYLGVFKNAWQGDENGVTNDSPVAGVIERGARPHGVNAEGRAAIQQWAERKLGLDEKEASVVMRAVVAKLRKDGQVGLFLVRDNIPKFVEWLDKEITRCLVEAQTKGGLTLAADED
jgi:hypothetical protein